MTGTRKAVRAMKARRGGRLSCGHHVLAGALIVRVGGQWVCGPCRFGQLHELALMMIEPPRPSGRDHDEEDNAT